MLTRVKLGGHMKPFARILTLGPCIILHADVFLRGRSLGKGRVSQFEGSFVVPKQETLGARSTSLTSHSHGAS